DTLPFAYSNGPVYFQGPTFNASDPYGYAGENMINYYDHNGTYVRNLTDLVGGMTTGDEIFVKASDGMTRYFNYTNVYTPSSNQGELVLAWWDSVGGYVPSYSEGIRLFFYTPKTGSYGIADSLNFTLVDMRDSLAPWYRYNYSGTWPSAKGLSVKYVRYLYIYPPHRYDFNTTGDTTEWAYEGGVGATPGMNEPNTAFGSTSAIADNDGDSYQTDSISVGEYAAHRFVFNISENPNNIESLVITWIGEGTNESGSNGADLYIWNGSSYELLQGDTSSGEITLSGEKTSAISSYISGGNVVVLVKQKSATNTEYDSLIETNYVKIKVTHHHSN
ncbi:MAG: hypothetical protein WC406_04490, partial [Methanoregula sp.]